MRGYWPPIVNVSAIKGCVLDVVHDLYDMPRIKLPSARQDSVTEHRSSGSLAPDIHANCDVGNTLRAKLKELLDNVEPAVEEDLLLEIRRNVHR
jgi:hypothetical protein